MVRDYTKTKNIRKLTQERHALMDCKVFEVKVSRTKLSKYQKTMLSTYFRQANYIYNHLVAHGTFDTTSKEIEVLCGDKYETRQLELGSGIKQGIREKFYTSTKSLKGRKSQGYKIGRLKFKSYTNVLPLKQYNNTYSIDFDKNTIRIQGIKQPFRVRGLKQIPADAEICNAELVRKASGYYFHIVTFVPKKVKLTNGQQVGIDFGIKTNITLSNGEKFNTYSPESKGTKLASRRFNRKKKGSNNRRRSLSKLRVAYEKDTNKRQDKAKKLIAYLSTFDLVAFQDENIKAWHKVFGKKVQHSSMGFIKAALQTKANSIMIDQSFPSTQLCPVCGSLTKHNLNKRNYDCQHCGYHHDDRDVKAAQTILKYATNVSPEQRANSLVELKISARVESVDSKLVSLDCEARRFYPLG